MIYSVIVEHQVKDHESQVLTFYVSDFERACAVGSLLEKVSTESCAFHVRNIVYNPFNL